MNIVGVHKHLVVPKGLKAIIMDAFFVDGGFIHRGDSSGQACKHWR